MARNVQTIRIESINGGISTYEFVAQEDQYNAGYGINIDDNRVGPTTISPTQPTEVTGSTTLTSVPVWMQGSPKGDTDIFVYDAKGSVYTYDQSNTVTGIGDLNDGGTAEGNGMAYYDNYMYFARSTTVARYGPLNGTPTFTDDFWVSTLGKTALRDWPTEYHNSGYSEVQFPNHVMHRHKDGRLYFADVVDGQGVIHFIKTSKTTVQGDTDDGSTYGALYLPYGYGVTDIESFGDDLVISAIEGNLDSPQGKYNYDRVYEGRAAMFFWDTTSDQYYKIIQDEFPDNHITALDNANGVLYTFSRPSFGAVEPSGVRVMRYLGGESFEQIAYQENTNSPLPGATATLLNQLLFGSQVTSGGACVWAIGSQNQPLSNSLHIVSGARKSTGTVTALIPEDAGAPWSQEIFFAYSNNDSDASGTIEHFGGSTSLWDTDLRTTTSPNAYWNSNWFTVGRRFYVKEVRFFCPSVIVSGTDLRIYLKKDRLTNSETLIDTITNEKNFNPDYFHFNIRPDSFICSNSFQLVFKWFGSRGVSIALPIEIDYEVIND